MDRKTFLRRGVVLLMVVGVGLAMVPFVGSWQPGAGADAARTRVKLPMIAPGTYAIVENPLGIADRNSPWSLLVYRPLEGQHRVWFVRLEEGKVVMPDIHWGKWGGLCKNFGPSSVDGIVDETQPIKCHDSERGGAISESWPDHLQWDINGKHLLPPGSTTRFDDMQRVPGIVVDDEFIYGRKRT